MNQLSVAGNNVVRILGYLREQYPWIEGIFRFKLGGLIGRVVIIYIVVLFLPLISIICLKLALKMAPAEESEWLRQKFVAAIHSGYDIDEVRQSVANEAAKNVLEKLSKNNLSLDYVQYFEFQLNKVDEAKEIPIQLHIGQRANLIVKRVVPVFIAESSFSQCAVAEIEPLTNVLSVQLGKYPIASLAAMSRPGQLGLVQLSPAWWLAHKEKIFASASVDRDNTVPSIVFSKTPEFQKAMSPCTQLKVEAAVEVFKQDVGA